MRSLPRWSVVVALVLASASLASAEGRIAIPATANLAVDVAMGQVHRAVLYENIVHYSWVVRVGPGKHDVIRLHRVVKEVRPNKPASFDQAVMFFPGSPTYFEGLYLTPLISDTPARDHAIAIYLAKNDIDVWGMDYRWAMVPENTTDFRFMKKWGTTRDVEDAQIALTLARWIRGRWVGLADPLFLAGLSYGGLMSYAVAANDTQRPRRFRNVRGIIPIDYGIKYKEPEYKAGACAYLGDVRQAMKDGTYAWDNRVMWAMGQLAIDDPNGLSPLDDTGSLTNFQFGLVVGTSPNNPVIPWHFVGGVFDGSGMPTGLGFIADTRLFFDLLAKNEPPYIPVQVDVETSTVECDRPHAGPTYADHLDEVTVPIFYVGAAGGFGHFGEYATTLTASTDVSILIVQRLLDDQRSEDYGHADLMIGDDAEQLVWRPILDWIKARR